MSDTARSAELLTPGQTRWSIPLSTQAPKPALLRALAKALLAGQQTPEQIAARCARTLGRHWRWLPPLAAKYLTAFEGQTRPRLREVIAFLFRDPGFQRAWIRYRHKLRIHVWPIEPQQMQPVLAAAAWNLPVLESERALADWLHLDWEDLTWLADLKKLGARKGDPRLQHYHSYVHAKKSGAVRLIESPKSRLKEAQRQILTGLLNRIPLHDAVHGFVKGRSIQTFAAPHVGQQILLRMDLNDFFPSISATRVQAVFRTAGYPERVAALLGGLCTNAAPRDVWSGCGPEIAPGVLNQACALYARTHLPQGAPCSPALANVCAYRVDCRLSGLAEAAGANYTRYADDLAFSGGKEFDACVERFLPRAAAIVLEEGLAVNHRKTRRMRPSQRQSLAGLVTNTSLHLPRPEFDRLKAILTNCVRHGAASQNRLTHASFRAHLQGRVAFAEMVSATQGNRLRRIFDRIEW